MFKLVFWNKWIRRCGQHQLFQFVNRPENSHVRWCQSDNWSSNFGWSTSDSINRRTSCDLNSGEKFTKLNLSDAYLQVELDEESKELVVVNTSMVLHRYNRMPFGIAYAPAILQPIMDQVVARISSCVAYLDDILISDINEEEHFKILEMTLSKLQRFGVRHYMDKCAFFQEQVSYLRYIISKPGKQPDPKWVEAIKNLPTPEDVKLDQGFIGKINYYGKFIPNFADLCAPLNRLRKKYEKWNSTRYSQQAFGTLEQQLCEATTLVHLEPKFSIIVATDASNYGIEAVIVPRYPNDCVR